MANHRKLFVAEAIAETGAEKASTVTATPTEATDEQVADLERRFGRDGIVELTYQIALENLRSRMSSAMPSAEQGFNSGDACRVLWADAEATRKA